MLINLLENYNHANGLVAQQFKNFPKHLLNDLSAIIHLSAEFENSQKELEKILGDLINNHILKLSKVSAELQKLAFMQNFKK